jgi:hypothetical protein
MAAVPQNDWRHFLAAQVEAVLAVHFAHADTAATNPSTRTAPSR